MQIRKARPDEFDRVRQFYHSLIDAAESAEYKPGWIKGQYPSDGYLKDSIEKGELYIGEQGERVACAMIMNNYANECYSDVKWTTDAPPEKITVLHALGVHPDFGRRGIAKELIAFAADLARERAQTAIRLDTLSSNIPAQRLYKSAGFIHLGRFNMYYDDTGWTDFELYEYPL